MVTVDGDLKRVLEIHDDNGSAIGVEDGVGLGVAGDENTSATLGEGSAGVSLR